MLMKQFGCWVVVVVVVAAAPAVIVKEDVACLVALKDMQDTTVVCVKVKTRTTFHVIAAVVVVVVVMVGTEVGLECNKRSSVLSVVWLVKKVRITQAVRLRVQRDHTMSIFGNVVNVPLSKKVHRHLGVVDVAD